MADDRSKIDEILQKTLNIHGYGFQYRVIREAQHLYGKGSRWLFEVAEFPVTVRGRDARIDFILQLLSRNVFLVAECKRVNPALSNWCFVRAPYIRNNLQSGQLIFQNASIDGNANLRPGISTSSSERVYHLAFELSSGEKGEPNGSIRGGLEKAAEQVLLGVNGLVESIGNNKLSVPLQQLRYYLPVIFTTANLFTTEVDLASASLDSGNVNINDVKTKPQNWLWYQYHQSPTLKHSTQRFDHTHNVINPKRGAVPSYGEVLDNEFSRSIAIVNASAIEAFLKTDPTIFDLPPWRS